MRFASRSVARPSSASTTACSASGSLAGKSASQRSTARASESGSFSVLPNPNIEAWVQPARCLQSTHRHLAEKTGTDGQSGRKSLFRKPDDGPKLLLEQYGPTKGPGG